ncbi:MAG: hypothetical protein JW739_02060 [Opitutales bacterium]|nr:hypothetical protein [Opitutales bacterium]
MDIDSDNLTGIVVVFIIFGIPSICITLVILFAMMRGKHRSNRHNDEDDTRIIQQMNRTLNDLEDRIETLETILIDREKVKGREQL